ncbi:unnamed protein product [Arctogadus glacialis]
MFFRTSNASVLRLVLVCAMSNDRLPHNVCFLCVAGGVMKVFDCSSCLCPLPVVTGSRTVTLPPSRTDDSCRPRQGKGPSKPGSMLTLSPATSGMRERKSATLFVAPGR